MVRMLRMIILPGAPRMGPRIGPPGRRGGHRPPRRPKVAKTLHFPLFLRPAGHLPPLSEISDKVPTICQIVRFSLEISTIAARLCSRLQPQPHCGRGTVQNHPRPGCQQPRPGCLPPSLLCNHAFRLNLIVARENERSPDNCVQTSK